MTNFETNFDRSNKTSGVYWTRQSMNNVKFRVLLKPLSAHTGNYLTNFTKTENNNHSFHWQEKVFSQWEYKRYEDIHNCISETELEYHDMILNSDVKVDKVFTLINEDELSFPIINMNTKRKSSKNTWSKLYLDSIMLKSHSNSSKSLFRSQEDLSEMQQWTSMFIVFDNSTYNEDSQLVLRQESLLLQIHYNSHNNCLLIFPNTNNIDFDPYSVELTSGLIMDYIYSVEMIIEDDKKEEMFFLERLLEKLEVKRKHIAWTSAVPSKIKKCFITLEILSLECFETDNLYVEYNIKVPEKLTMHNENHGTTHTARGTKINNNKRWHYAHNLDIELSYPADINTELLELIVYFEVISRDWLGVRRTEGYSFIELKLTPENRKRTLTCLRPEELDMVHAANRRFFLGGFHLMQDLDVLVQPQNGSAFRYVTTGKINVQFQTIVQHCHPVIGPSTDWKTPSSGVLQGAEVALQRYKKAKARLAAVTRDLAKSGD